MVGTSVIAIDACVMNNGKAHLTIGKVYEVIDSKLYLGKNGYDIAYVIINDNKEPHSFSSARIREFFKIK